MKKILPFVITILTINIVVGQIQFVPYKKYPRADGTTKTCIADINNDGLKDVIISTTSSFNDTINDYKLFLYLQNSLNNLDTNPVVYSYPRLFPGLRAMTCGDVNNDSLVDIIIGYSDTIGIFYQNPSGILNPIIKFWSGQGVDAIKTGDLNHDGLTDIAVCHWNATYIKIFYQGLSVFTTTTYPKPAGGYDDIDVGDVNNDGLNDLAWVSQQRNGLSVFLQSSDSLLPFVTYIPPPHNAVSNTLNGVSIGDLNGDGRNDVVTTRGGNTPEAWIEIWYQDTITSALKSAVELDAFDIPMPIRIDDLNCDGKNEIIVGHDGWHTISYYTLQTDSSFGPYTSIYIGSAQMNAASMAIGDISNDGRPDIATTIFDNGMITLINNSIPEKFSQINTTISIDTLFIDSLTYTSSNWSVSVDSIPPYIITRVDTFLYTFIYQRDTIKTDTVLIRTGEICSHSYIDTLSFISVVGNFKEVSRDSILIGSFIDTAFVGINEINEIFSLTFQPNPITEFITLETGRSNILQKIILYSSNGRRIKTIENYSRSVTLNFEEFPPGIYFLDCSSRKGRRILRIVKL